MKTEQLDKFANGVSRLSIAARNSMKTFELPKQAPPPVPAQLPNQHLSGNTLPGKEEKAQADSLMKEIDNLLELC